MLIEQPARIEYEHGGCLIACLVTGEEWKQNTYIVTHKSSSNTIVIDPGGEAELIIRQIVDARGKLAHILLTHAHHDHVGAASKLCEHYNMACRLHKQDVRLLVHAPMYAWSFASKKIPAVSRFQTFEELCLVDEEPSIRALHTPGHTKGSVCYISGGFAFTGDTLLYKRIGRTDLPGSSSDDLSGSVEKLLSALTDETIMFPGHGKPWTIGEAKQWWLELRGKPPVHTSFSDELN
jgi:glyoxylase-like metal-dependent hydrolase (beta-lactamase superfamily II)